jgi:hypothetical protein
MKLSRLLRLCGAFLLAALMGTPANARSCSLSGVAGTYGYTTSGSIPTLGAIAGVGHITLDSAGNLTGAQTVSFNGTIVPETLSGTYTVNADCTGTATINVYHGGVLARTTNLNVVYVNEQRELRAIFLTAGTALTVNGRKTFSDDD